MDDTTPPTIDAEIVTDATTPTPQGVNPPGAPTAAFDINAYNATLETVRRRLVIIEKSKEEYKKLKEMHDDGLANDPLYQKANEIVKEATQKRKDIQMEISRQPAMAEVTAKLKDLKEQLKANQDSLAEELMEYYRTAGVTEIEDESGQVQEFVISIRLKPKLKVG